jgi:hypothetical protein
LRLAAYRWINRFLKGDDAEVTEPEVPPFPDEELRAFPDELPADEINTKIDESFVPLAGAGNGTAGAGNGTAGAGNGTASVPYVAWREGLLERLRRLCFRAWPKAPTPSPSPDGRGGEGETNLAFGAEPRAGVVATEPPLECTFHYFPGKNGTTTRWLIVLNDDESEENLPDWARPLVGDDAAALFSPRGVGAGAWTEEPPYYVRRSLALLGQTVDSGRVWDVRTFAAQAAASDEAAVWQVAGRGQAGLIGAYAALFTPALQSVTVVDPPTSHHDGPIFLNVLRVLDLPVALGLLAPRPLRLRGADATAFADTVRLYELAGARERLRWE